MRIKMKRFLGILLTLTLVLGLMPGMSLTAYATPAETLLTTITATGKTTYNQSVEGVVTVTLADIESYIDPYGWLNSGTITVALVEGLEGYTITKCRFIQNGKTPLVDDSAPFSIVIHDGICSVITSTGQMYGQSMDGVTSIEVYGSAPHTHSFTYSASGATITATCTAEGCGLPESSAGAGDHVATLTIAANGGTYDGTTTYGATITDANSIKGSATVSYYKANDEGTDKTGEALTGAPTDAGKYWAEITLTNTENNSTATAHVVYTIAKIDPATPTNLSATYGQKLEDVELSGGWTWATPTDSVGNVGTNTFKVNHPGSDNYNAKSDVDVTVTVGKATPVISAEDKSVKISKTVSLGATITPEVGVTWGYTSNNESIATVSTDGVVTGVAEGSTTITIIATATDATNYNDPENKTVNITVFSKNPQTVTASNVTVTYGDTNKSVSGTSSGTGAISYTVTSGSDVIDVDASSGALTIKKAGTATVTVTAAETTGDGPDDSGYAQATKDVTVTVNPKDLTITAQNKTIFVDGTVPDLSNPALDTDYTVAGLVVGDALSTAPTLAYKKNGEAVTPVSTTTGTYDIVPSGASAGANYSISYVNGTLTISEKEPAVVTKAPAAKNPTYTGSAQKLVTAGEAKGGEMQYALGTKNAATEPYTASIPSKTNAGTYYVWYKAVGDGEHTDTNPQSVTVTVSKASIRPTVSIVGWTYGEAANAPKVTGNRGHGTVNYTYAVKESTEFSKTVPTEAGEYTVKARIAATANYRSAETTADFTISKAASAVITAPTAKTDLAYDGSAQELVVAGEAAGGTMQYAVTVAETAPDASAYLASIPTAAEAGVYDVWYMVKGDGNHDDSEADSVTVTIAQKPITSLTVSFDTDGGSEVEDQTVEYGKAAVRPADPTREGYAFLGWQLNGAEYDFTAPVTESITLNAVWQAVQPDEKELIKAFVRRNYELILLRDFDQEGLVYWCDLLYSGEITAADMVNGFIHSDEFTSRGLSESETVRILYRAMLGREAEEAGLNHWVGLLNDGVSISFIVNGFAGSPEFADVCAKSGIEAGAVTDLEWRDRNLSVTRFVNRCYNLTLGRQGEPYGLNYWCEKLMTEELDAAEVAEGFVFSDESIGHDLSDTDFVLMMYRLYLGREAEQKGFDFWLSTMADGMTRQEVAAGFAASPEFADIVASYGLTLKTDSAEEAEEVLKMSAPDSLEDSETAEAEKTDEAEDILVDDDKSSESVDSAEPGEGQDVVIEDEEVADSEDSGESGDDTRPDGETVDDTEMAYAAYDEEEPEREEAEVDEAEVSADIVVENPAEAESAA